MQIVVPDHVLSVSRDTLAEFFIGFARFEFSLLKAAGFAKNGRDGCKVDWDSLSSSVGPLFLPANEKDLGEAISYLLKNSPKKQTLSNGSLGWKHHSPAANWSEMRLILFCVQGARNNLVHGAKFLAKESDDIDRDGKLIEAASCVIWSCLETLPSLQHAFDSETL